MSRILSLLVLWTAILLPPTQARTWDLISPWSCTDQNKTAIVYRGDSSALRGIYKDLVSCPNITSLELDLTLSGCVVPPEPWYFDFRNGDKFPALRKLTLSGYDFSERPGMDIWDIEWTFGPSVNQAVQKVKGWLTPTVFAVRESNLEKWMKAMDFSRMEELNLGQEYSPLYKRLQHHLPSLKTLGLSLFNPGTAMCDEHVEFLRNIPPLQNLSIGITAPYPWSDAVRNRTNYPLQDIVHRHCPTLTHLALHQGESSLPGLHRPMLSLDDLALLRTSCPNLTHLQLDLDRDAEKGWPNATFDALTQFPNLRALELNFELGADLHDFKKPFWYDNEYDSTNPLSGRGPFREPRFSHNITETLFEELSRKKEGLALERVDFVVGDYTDEPYMGPLTIGTWEDERAVKFICNAGATHGDGQHCVAQWTAA